MSVSGKIRTIRKKLKEIWKMLTDKLFWKILKEQMRDSFRNPIGM